MSSELNIWVNVQSTHTKRVSVARVAAPGFPGVVAVARESTTFCSTFHLNGLMHQTRVLYFSSAVNIFSLNRISIGMLSSPNYTANCHTNMSATKVHLKAVLNLEMGS